MNQIESLKKKIIDGGEISMQEAIDLANSSDKDALYTAAEEITRHFGSRAFDTCSIINARAGKCSENCKWCAQSAHFKTGADEHGLVSEHECLTHARYNERKGVKRFSLVTSGRALTGAALDSACMIYKSLGEKTGMSLCASLGLLSREELEKLYASGVRRYHCNLETAPSYFPKLCTTHTIDDKIRTIKWAKEIGFEVCSGGIIGMGETMEQRIELAFKLKEIEPHSIPINILCPIKGTPLENSKRLTDEEILTTIAVFRFVHPHAQLRFAGGRAQLSRDAQKKAIEIGMNSAVVGDLLTTIGSKIDEDKQLIRDSGYCYSEKEINGDKE